MNNLITCIECGHYPVSNQASLCPKCLKNPRGYTCQICSLKVAQSKAIVEKDIGFYELIDDYDVIGKRIGKYVDDYKYFYYHQTCVDKINTIYYKCASCSSINTKFSKSCFNCGFPFPHVKCDCCKLLLLEVLSIKGDNILGADRHFHNICASKIRPQLEANARANAKREEERAIIKERQQKEEKLRYQQWREEHDREERIEIRKRLIDDWWNENSSLIVINIFLWLVIFFTLDTMAGGIAIICLIISFGSLADLLGNLINLIVKLMGF